MRIVAPLALAELVRAPGRTLRPGADARRRGRRCSRAMLLFVGHSLRTMTGGAVRSVPLDWQGPVGSYRAATARRRAASRSQPGVAEAAATATAPFAGARAHSAPVGHDPRRRGLDPRGPARLPRAHPHVPLPARLAAAGPGRLDQQLAATLQAQPGDTVTLTPRPGAQADALGSAGSRSSPRPTSSSSRSTRCSGPAPAQPPANIAILPLGTFARTVAPCPAVDQLRARRAPPFPARRRGIQWQVQAQVDPAALTRQPGACAEAGRPDPEPGRALAARPGLSSSTTSPTPQHRRRRRPLRRDALHHARRSGRARRARARLPGRARHRRARPARPGAAARARRPPPRLVCARRRSRASSSASSPARSDRCVALAARPARRLGGRHRRPAACSRRSASASLLAVARRRGRADRRRARAFRGSVAEGAAQRQRDRDAALAAALPRPRSRSSSRARLLADVRTGFSAVVNPDSNPTLSLVGLHVPRAGAALARRGAAARPAARPRCSPGSRAGRRRVARRPRLGFLLASAGRRGAAINRGLLVLGLLLAFGVSLGIFAATYDQQASVDAQLTLGADVVATAPPGRRRARTASSSDGRRASRRRRRHRRRPLLRLRRPRPPGHLRHRSGDAHARRRRLRDSYFVGGSADADARAAAHDAGRDPRLQGDDHRLLASAAATCCGCACSTTRTGRFRVVPFHVVGTVQEFPSAPTDSFMVANLALPRARDARSGPERRLRRARAATRRALAARVAAATEPLRHTVKDIRQQTAQTVSSITTVDLTRDQPHRGGVRARPRRGGDGALRRRRRSPSGATSSRRWPRSARRCAASAAFLWSEAVLVLVAALVLAALLGWLLAEMLVAMLQHVFDPPPDHLASLGLPRRARRRRGRAAASSPPRSPRCSSAACRSARSCARSDDIQAMSFGDRPGRRGRRRAARRRSAAASREEGFAVDGVATGDDAARSASRRRAGRARGRHRPARRGRARPLPGAARARRPDARCSS